MQIISIGKLKYKKLRLTKHVNLFYWQVSYIIFKKIYYIYIYIYMNSFTTDIHYIAIIFLVI